MNVIDHLFFQVLLPSFQVKQIFLPWCHIDPLFLFSLLPHLSLLNFGVMCQSFLVSATFFSDFSIHFHSAPCRFLQSVFLIMRQGSPISLHIGCSAHFITSRSQNCIFMRFLRVWAEPILDTLARPQGMELWHLSYRWAAVATWTVTSLRRVFSRSEKQIQSININCCELLWSAHLCT